MKKKQLTIFLVLLLIVFVLFGAFLYVLRMYNQKGLSLITSFDEAYDYNGKLLLSKDREKALLLNALGKTEFEELPLETLDLTPFGFEGKTFSYYKVKVEEEYGIKKTFLYTPDPSYEGLWPALREDRIIYRDEEGKKYCIHPEEGLCYPMFSDSISGVDPYGTHVLGFSGNASYALSLSGEKVTVYHTDPMDGSLRIVDVKEVSLADFGKDIRFGAFLNNTDAYFTVKGEKGDILVALNCKTGQAVQSALDLSGEYSKPLNRLYAQRLDEEEKEELTATWSHLLLGEKTTSRKLSGFDSVELLTVSPGGTYAVGVAKNGKTEEILCLSKKRNISLSSFLSQGEKVLKVEFIYENLIFVTVENEKGEMGSLCYKICF